MAVAAGVVDVLEEVCDDVVWDPVLPDFPSWLGVLVSCGLLLTVVVTVLLMTAVLLVGTALTELIRKYLFQGISKAFTI